MGLGVVGSRGQKAGGGVDAREATVLGASLCTGGLCTKGRVAAAHKGTGWTAICHGMVRLAKRPSRSRTASQFRGPSHQRRAPHAGPAPSPTACPLPPSFLQQRHSKGHWPLGEQLAPPPRQSLFNTTPHATQGSRHPHRPLARDALRPRTPTPGHWPTAPRDGRPRPAGAAPHLLRGARGTVV